MRNMLLYFSGLIILAINTIRYRARGYREPRPFSPSDIQRGISYDCGVVDGWLKALHDYTSQRLEGKVVLELGPGADLGPALFLLEHGADRYITLDAHRLIDQTPRRFYDELLATLSQASVLKPELEKTLAGNGDRIQYVVDSTFNLSALKDRGIDLVVSQAAFEHFSNIEKTIQQLSSIVKSGCGLVAEVDLMTHTGVLRKRDPLNIYRFSPWLYRLARFSGIPNRVRPQTYKTALEKNGWYNVQIIPLQTLAPEELARVKPSLPHIYRADPEMHILTFLLLATKS